MPNTWRPWPAAEMQKAWMLNHTRPFQNKHQQKAKANKKHAARSNNAVQFNSSYKQVSQTSKHCSSKVSSPPRSVRFLWQRLEFFASFSSDYPPPAIRPPAMLLTCVCSPAHNRCQLLGGTTRSAVGAASRVERQRHMNSWGGAHSSSIQISRVTLQKQSHHVFKKELLSYPHPARFEP